VTAIHRAHHDLLADFGPETWGEVIAQVVLSLAPLVVLATGTDRGNEVLAHAAARLDLPMAANCTALRPASTAPGG
jgi:electron transfer flavoprotein alpha subunit